MYLKDTWKRFSLFTFNAVSSVSKIRAAYGKLNFIENKTLQYFTSVLHFH